MNNLPGSVLYGWSTAGRGLGSQKEVTFERIKTAVREELSIYSGMLLLQLRPNLREDRRGILVEVVGSEGVAPKDLVKLEEVVSKKVGQPLEIYIWTSYDTVVTEGGIFSFKELLKKEMPEWEKSVMGNWHVD